MSTPGAFPVDDPLDNQRSASPSPSSSVLLYKPPTALSLLRTTTINLILPFINGLMLGFGELFAHEIAFRWGWGTTRVFPEHRLGRRAGPGVEIREKRGRVARPGLEDAASLE